jgi:hypothetical protein
VRHSGCGQPILVKEPYDVNRFWTHVQGCKGDKKRSNFAGRTCTLEAMGQVSIQKVKTASPPQAMIVPCPGLTNAENQKISVYLKRSGAAGGGARSLARIAAELFKTSFKKLNKACRKVILNVQQHEYLWRNDHNHLRIFSTTCEKSTSIQDTEVDGRIHPCQSCLALLPNRRFIDLLNKPVPADDNYIYVNRRFQNQILSEAFAKVKGLKHIIETAVCLYPLDS